MNRDAILRTVSYLIKLAQKFLNMLPPEPPKPTPTPTPVPPKYQWDTPAQARHSVRVICDELGFSLKDKNEMCATVQVESGFNIHVVHPNRDENGKVLSTDYGICQWNDVYHGQEITPIQALDDPEKAVRLMAKYWKMGEQFKKWWIAYRSGAYKQYL